MLESRPRLRRGLQWGLAALLTFMGIAHFAAPAGFMAIMPPQLPAHRLLVYLSGVAELSIGIGLMIPRLTRLAAWGAIALFVAVYPANIYHAIQGGIDHPDLPAAMANPIVAYVRLPFQFLFIAWAYVFTRPAQRN